MLAPLLPAATLADLHPPRTVFAPRTTWRRARWAVSEPYRLDALTGHTLAVMGRMPLICHQAVATPLALDFMRACGLSPPENLVTFATEQEAVALADSRVRQGEKLVYVYPPPAQIDSPSSVLVPIPEYAYLNDKRNLAELVGPDRIPRRQILPYADASEFELAAPAFLKAAVAGANGGGHDVRYCTDRESWESALQAFSKRGDGDLDQLIVEDAIEIGTCWCMGAAVLDNEVRYLGCASQIFAAPTVQTGNRVDPLDLAPDEAVTTTLEIAERARGRGYRGIAGFDMGIGPGGRLFVFDLNFRLNASTTALLLHASATARAGGIVSETWLGTAQSELGPMLDAALPLAEAGVFVPTRFYEGTPESRGTSVLSGIVVGQSSSETTTLCKTLDAMVSRL